MTEDNTGSRLRIAVVIGSVRGPRLADPLAAWVERELTAIDWLDLDVIDLAWLSSLSPLGRVGTPADLAGAVAFLTGDDSRWVTGHWPDASGG